MNRLCRSDRKLFLCAMENPIVFADAFNQFYFLSPKYFEEEEAYLNLYTF